MMSITTRKFEWSEEPCEDYTPKMANRQPARVCDHFLLGICEKGDSCNFAHKKRVFCKFQGCCNKPDCELNFHHLTVRSCTIKWIQDTLNTHTIPNGDRHARDKALSYKNQLQNALERLTNSQPQQMPRFIPHRYQGQASASAPPKEKTIEELKKELERLTLMAKIKELNKQIYE